MSFEGYSKPNIAAPEDIFTMFGNSDIYTNTDNEHIGSYRIGKRLLMRLMRRKVYGMRNGKRELMNNVTNKELAMLILLLQIADNNNYIGNLSMREILAFSHSDGTRFICEKTFYNTLRRLSEKGYISYTKRRTCYDIQVLGNEIRKHEKYLYLNRNIFIHGEEQEHKFSSLSLGAKKIMMYLLYRMSPGTKYQGDLRHLQKIIGIKTSALMATYLNEIETILGPISRLCSDITKKPNGRFVLTASNRTSAAPNQALKKHQANYMRRCFRRLCIRHSVSLDDGPVIKASIQKQKKSGLKHFAIPDKRDIENYYSSRLFGILGQSYRLTKDKRKIFSAIEYILAETHLLNMQTLGEISYILNLAH